MNLASLVSEHPASSRALYDGGQWLTWGEVRRKASAASAALGRLGVGRGDRVGLSWPNSSGFVAWYLGVLAAGAVAVPLNPNSPVPELVREVRLVETSVLLAGGAAAAHAPDLSEAVPGLRVLAAADLETEEPDEAEAQTAGDLSVVERADDELAVLLFTSGTAGAARAAKLTHGNLVANLQQMLALGEVIEPGDIALAAVPLFHIFGLNVALGFSFATGAALVLEGRFDPAGSLELVRDLGVTVLMGVPTMFAAWADVAEGDPDLARTSRAKLRRALSGAAALVPEVAERFEQRFGVPVWQGYGLTEASPAVSTTFGTGRSVPGSVGRPVPGVEVRVVDDTGEQVLDGDPGEIWVRGPNVFAGYWKDDDATAEVLSADGWLRTGDVGVIGDHGDLYVVDRAKDLVIVSGFNVFPGEVEHVVCELPGVVAAAVVGRPDPVTGEAVAAVVVRAPGSSVTEDDVRAHCAAHLARYKCPSSVRFVPELPTGLAGKALRRALREQVA